MYRKPSAKETLRQTENNTEMLIKQLAIFSALKANDDEICFHSFDARKEFFVN